MKPIGFNKSIEKAKLSIDELHSQQAIMTELTTYLKNLRIQHQHEASLLRTVLNSNPDDFTELLLNLTDGPDQVTHTVIRNIYFYMTANYGSGLFNSNLHLYQLLVSGNLFVVIPVLVGAVFFAGYYAIRKWYELKKQREMSQFDYAVDQLLKANPELAKDPNGREKATVLMTKQVAKSLLTYIANRVNAAEEATVNPNPNKESPSRLERFFARIRNSNVSATANSAWMTLALASMTSWIIFATGIITGLTIAFPISASIVVGVVTIALAFRAYKYFSAAGKKKTTQKSEAASADEKLDQAKLAELLDPAKEMKARHQQRVKDFMAVDFESKEITLEKLYDKVNPMALADVKKDKKRQATILNSIKHFKNSNIAINEIKSGDSASSFPKDSDKENSIPALYRLKNSWWNKDSRTRTVVVAILGASFGFMSTSFLFAPLTNTVVAILTKAGVAATATVITALSIGVGAIIVAAIVGIYLGIYYHYARKQEAKENADKLADITKEQNSFTIGETTYEQTSKAKVMKGLLTQRDSLKEVIGQLKEKYKQTLLIMPKNKSLPDLENMPDLNNLPGYENHTYFTEMRYERSLASKIDDIVKVGLAGLDGLGTGFFMPRSNYITSHDSLMVAAGVLGLTIAIAIFHPPLLMVIIMAGIMGACFAVFKALRARYTQVEKADQVFLEQFDMRVEYLQKEVEYLELYKETLLNLIAIAEVTQEPIVGVEGPAKRVDLSQGSAKSNFLRPTPTPTTGTKTINDPIREENAGCIPPELKQ